MLLQKTRRMIKLKNKLSISVNYIALSSFYLEVGHFFLSYSNFSPCLKLQKRGVLNYDTVDA